MWTNIPNFFLSRLVLILSGAFAKTDSSTTARKYDSLLFVNPELSDGSLREILSVLTDREIDRYVWKYKWRIRRYQNISCNLRKLF